MVNEQGSAVQAPLHPAKEEPLAGCAVKVMPVPPVQLEVQAPLAQYAPGGSDEVLPVPVPASVTVRLYVGAAPVPVANAQTTLLARALPATSLTPVVIAATQTVLAGRVLAGVKVATLPFTA